MHAILPDQSAPSSSFIDRLLCSVHVSRHVILCLALSATAAPVRADLLSDIRHEGTIRIAIAGEVPPFNYEDAGKHLTGSDVDTARLLAQGLGVKLDIVRISNSERVAALKDHRADLVISALSITAEREREIAFSVPYAKIAIVIAAPSPIKLSSMLDLKDRTIGVLADSSNLSHLHRAAPECRIIEYPENSRLSEGYGAGEFEIMSAPESVVDATNRQNKNRPLIVQFTQTEFSIAVGIPKGEKPLRDWVNNWVVKHLRDNSLDTVYLKHHGHHLQPSILPVPSAGDAQ